MNVPQGKGMNRRRLYTSQPADSGLIARLRTPPIAGGASCGRSPSNASPNSNRYLHVRSFLLASSLALATVAAGSVFRLLGAKDLGVSNDYLTEKMPPMLTDMLNGELAWRQHDGGHTDAPNFKYFIPWASKFLKYERTAR